MFSPGLWLEQTRTRSREPGLEEAALLSLVFHRLTFPFHPSRHVDLFFRVLSLHLGFPRTSGPHPPEDGDGPIIWRLSLHDKIFIATILITPPLF